MATEKYTFDDLSNSFLELRCPFCRSKKSFHILREQVPHSYSCWVCSKDFKIASKLEIKQIITIDFDPNALAANARNRALSQSEDHFGTSGA